MVGTRATIRATTTITTKATVVMAVMAAMVVMTTVTIITRVLMVDGETMGKTMDMDMVSKHFIKLYRTRN